MSGAWGTVLQPAVGRLQPYEMDALCEAVAKRFLVVDAHGRAEVALSVSVNGTPQIAGPGHGGAVAEDAAQAAPRAAENAARDTLDPLDPLDAHALRQRGLVLLTKLAEQVADTFAANGVPLDVALEQAQDIVLRLADEELMTADEALRATLVGQQVDQRGVNLCIDGRKVSFHKTTTFVAASGAHEPAAPPPLTALIDVTMSFEAKPANAWLHAIDRHVKCFGSDKHWLLEGCGERATVWQAPSSDITTALREQLGAPPEPAGWRGAVAEWYRALETIFGRRGMVFNAGDFGRGAHWAAPARAPLDGVRDFMERAQGTQAVSAAPRGAHWRQRVAVYRRHDAGVSRDSAYARATLIERIPAEKRREAVEIALRRQQIDPQKPISNQREQFQAVGRVSAEPDFETYEREGALHYKVQVPPSSAGHAARLLGEVTEDVSEQRMRNLQELLVKDFDRNLMPLGRDYLMVNGVRLVADKFYDAYAALDSLTNDVEYDVAALPPALRTLIEDGGLPPIGANDRCTRATLAAAVRKQASVSAIDMLAQVITDADLQRQVTPFFTQTFDLTVDFVGDIYGVPVITSPVQQRRCHFTTTSQPDGRPGFTVHYERESQAPPLANDYVNIGVGSSFVIQPAELAHAKVRIATDWEVTADTIDLRRGTVEVDLKRK
ncbi:hypothetical protein MB84_29265 (plasmid) [Pandoraea oxalativorans]|uniref:Uncharacterized protein n=2 Tax=Pandoraea oxalativorans TaxID=573737 RepID=A0A0G3ICD7_9BURK|nr:hypothetical protein MB84_29265 [Pandoraea oxalativorans]